MKTNIFLSRNKLLQSFEQKYLAPLYGFDNTIDLFGSISTRNDTLCYNLVKKIL